MSEAKTLVYNFGVGGLYLTDAQSYPFIMAADTGELFRRDPDGEGHYSPTEVRAARSRGARPGSPCVHWPPPPPSPLPACRS